MALKRLQYVINAFLLPVSKFIEHYKNAIFPSSYVSAEGKVGLSLKTPDSTQQSFGIFIFSFFVAVKSIRIKINHEGRLENKNKN